MTDSLHLLLELTRAENADDAYAFRFRPQEYLLRTEGGGFRSAELDWSDDLLDDLEEVRTPGCSPAVVQRMGDRLHRFLAPADFARYEALIAEAVDAGAQVTLTIRSAAAELYTLPWELMTLPSSGQHLAELPGLLLRYAWPETRTATRAGRAGHSEQLDGAADASGASDAATAVEPAVACERVLIAWSAAGGRVPAAEHQRLIERAAEGSPVPFDPHSDVLENVSLRRLDDTLTAATRSGRPVAVLHILAHGAAQGDVFGLAFDRDQPEGDERRARRSARAVVDPGRLRQVLAPHAAHLRLVVLCACDSGNLGELGNHLGSVAQNLHSAGIAAVVASRFPLSVRGSARFTSVFYQRLLGAPSSVEQAFIQARQALARDAESLDWASLQLYGRPEDGHDTRPLTIRPYRGLLPFRAEHARFFFGRSAEISEILTRMHKLVENQQPRFLVVAGASGTGKSSVVLAGAVPELLRRSAKNGDSKPARAAEPDAPAEAGEPESQMQRLADILDQVGALTDSSHVRRHLTQAHESIASLRRSLREAQVLAPSGWQVELMRLTRDPMAALKTALNARRDPEQRFLLVIDQFEELFTSVDDVATRQTFARRLYDLCTVEGGIHCVVTVRVDFLGRGGELVLDERGTRLDQVAYDEAHRVFVAQMGPGQMREAIEEPARLVGLELERGLAATMLGDVGGEPGALPLLQYTLDLLWQRRRGRQLCVETYHLLGGVTGALQRKADAIIDSFDTIEKQHARRLLVRLVGVGDDASAGDTRRRAQLVGLRPIDPAAQVVFERVLAIFVEARLLVPGDEGGAAVIEVAHEALIRKWQRLRNWLHEDRDKLVELQELERWAEQYRDYGTLLVGEQLGYACMVRDKHPSDCDTTILEMINASVTHREDQRRRTRRRLRLLLATALLVALIMTGLGLWAVRESRVARSALIQVESEKRRVEKQKQRAERGETEAREAQTRAELARQQADEQRTIAEENEALAVRREKEAKEQRERAETEEERALEQERMAKIERFRAERARDRARQSETEAKASETRAVEARERAEKSENEAQRARDKTAKLLEKEQKRARQLEKRLNVYIDDDGLPGADTAAL